jgi:hypothetical protein
MLFDLHFDGISAKGNFVEENHFSICPKMALFGSIVKRDSTMFS